MAGISYEPLVRERVPATIVPLVSSATTIAPRIPTPLRVIVPGWEGAYSVKWLNHITASDHDHPGPFVSASYRVPRRPVPPGTVVNAADTVPIRGLVVKSIITWPADGAALMPGHATMISGFAWSGEYAIRTVEVSIDGGRSWATARGERCSRVPAPVISCSHRWRADAARLQSSSRWARSRDSSRSDSPAH